MLAQLAVGRHDDAGGGEPQREPPPRCSPSRVERRHATKHGAALGEAHRRADDELVALGRDDGDFDESLGEHAAQIERAADGARRCR